MKSHHDECLASGGPLEAANGNGICDPKNVFGENYYEAPHAKDVRRVPRLRAFEKQAVWHTRHPYANATRSQGFLECAGCEGLVRGHRSWSQRCMLCVVYLPRRRSTSVLISSVAGAWFVTSRHVTNVH